MPYNPKKKYRKTAGNDSEEMGLTILDCAGRNPDYPDDECLMFDACWEPVDDGEKTD